MKKLMNTLLLISLFVVFTSSTTSSKVIADKNLLSPTEECSPLANPSLSEFIGPIQMEMNNEDPFCFYYVILRDMWCAEPANPGQCAYYQGLVDAGNCERQ